jgi:hypothetical protein
LAANYGYDNGGQQNSPDERYKNVSRAEVASANLSGGRAAQPKKAHKAHKAFFTPRTPSAPLSELSACRIDLLAVLAHDFNIIAAHFPLLQNEVLVEALVLV